MQEPIYWMDKVQVAHTLKSKQEAGALQQTLALQIVSHCYLYKKKTQRPMSLHDIVEHNATNGAFFASSVVPGSNLSFLIYDNPAFT